MINPYVPEYNPALDVESMRIQAGLVQNLGAQVRQDLTTIQTNRQLAGLAKGLQDLTPESKEFGQQAVGLMMQYPLAAKSPIGTAAISQLGAQHKLWQQEELRKATGESYFNIPGTDTLVSRKTGNTRELPAGTVPRKRVQEERDAYDNIIAIRDPYNFNQPEALPEMPMKTSEDAVELEKIKQQNRLQLQAGRKAASVEEKKVGDALGKATVEYGKAKAEAARLQKLWEIVPEDDNISMDPGGKLKNRDLKYQIGAKADALRNQLPEYESQIKTLAEQLKSFTATPIIPGLTPADVNPVPVDQLGSGVAPESLIPAGIPEPSSAPKRRRFNPSTGTLE